MKSKFIYALSALMMVVMVFATSCDKEDPIDPTPSAKECTVTFNANGGTGTMTAQKVTKDKSTPLKANAYTYAEHTFSGWNTKSDGSGISYSDKSSVTLTANLTLYAQWIADAATTYTVTFNANGGTGTMKKMLVEESKETPLTTNTYTRTNYTFTEWNSKADGSGTSYADKTKVTLTADLTLYAQWETTAIQVTGVTLNKSTLTLGVGETETLVATIKPSNATNKKVTWKSSNTAVATASNGVVKAIKSGTATITVTSEDGSKLATCELTVKEPFTFADNTRIIELGEDDPQGSTTILVTLARRVYLGYYTKSADGKDVVYHTYDYPKTKWSSSDPTIVSVSKENVGESTIIYAKKEGTATITAEDEIGNKRTFIVKVNGLAEVGDFFYDDYTWSSELDKTKKVMGIVFEVTEDGWNGKVISADEGYEVWSSDCELIESTYDSGRKNMKVVFDRNNASSYKAFSWVDDKNPLFYDNYFEDVRCSWYLPAQKELEDVLRDDVLKNKINYSLQKAGGIVLLDHIYLWSSTQYDTNHAMIVPVKNNTNSSPAYKNTAKYHIRAFMAF